VKTAPVRELKNRLSSFLRLVKAGETVLVTEHGRVIAELRRPEPPGTLEPARVERILRGLEQAGRLRRAARAGSVVASLALARDPAAPDWRGVLDEVRSDRGGT
jgi:antitoxin (DNA-binding transcriptional repressor) of toxin-antitoxin stability system